MIGQKSLTKIDVYEDTGIYYTFTVAKISHILYYSIYMFDLYINTNSLEYINFISVISTIRNEL